MKKYVAKILVFLVLAQLVPVSEVLAQQPSGRTTATVAATKPLEPAPLPEMNFFVWEKYGVDPLVPADMLPAECKTPDDIDARWTCIQKVFLEEPGYEKASKMVWDGVAMVAFRNTNPVPAAFKRDLQDKIRVGKMRLETIPKNGNFFCGMAWSAKQANGTYVSRFTGPPRVAFDEQLQVFVVDPILMTEGPYYGHALAISIPTQCLNITCLEGVVVPETYPRAPQPPAPKLAKVTLIKEWVDESKRKAPPPPRQTVQVRMEAVSDNGGETFKVELFDNVRAEFEPPIGWTGYVQEYFTSDQWRALTERVRLEVKNDKHEVRFMNMLVPEQISRTPAAPPAQAAPPPVVERIIEREVCEEGCGGGKKKWIAAAIIGGIAGGVLAAKLMGGKKIVVQDARKGGSSSNGGAVLSVSW